MKIYTLYPGQFLHSLKNKTKPEQHHLSISLPPAYKKCGMTLRVMKKSCGLMFYLLAVTVHDSEPNDPHYLLVRRDITAHAGTGMTGMWIADRYLHMTTQVKLHEKATHTHTHAYRKENRNKLIESVSRDKRSADP